MKLFIVRHGETDANQQRILQGHMASHLTDNGWEQARHAANNLVDRGASSCSTIVSSDLKRAMDTAGVIASVLHLPVNSTSLLRERDWGTSTGMPIAEARERYYRDGRWQFPESTETEEQIQDRARRCLAMLAEQYVGQDLVVVTHGQLARYMIAAHFNCPLSEVTHMVNGEIRVLSI